MSAAAGTPARLSLENWVHILVCLCALALFVGFSLLPAYSRNEELRANERELRRGLAEHTELVLLASELNAWRRQEGVSAMPWAVERVELEREEFADMHARLDDLAQANGLRLEQAIPRVVSLRDGRHFLCVAVVASGPFGNMPPFIRGLIELPCYFQLAGLNVSKGEGHEDLEAQVWLSVK